MSGDHNMYCSANTNKECEMTTKTDWVPLPTLQDVVKAQVDGFVIEWRAYEKYEWQHWKERIWDTDWQFRGRPRQPVMKEAKLECWLISGMLYWYKEGATEYDHWIRQPHLDMIAKVPD